MNDNSGSLQNDKDLEEYIERNLSKYSRSDDNSKNNKNKISDLLVKRTKEFLSKKYNDFNNYSEIYANIYLDEQYGISMAKIHGKSHCTSNILGERIEEFPFRGNVLLEIIVSLNLKACDNGKDKITKLGCTIRIGIKQLLNIVIKDYENEIQCKSSRIEDQRISVLNFYKKKFLEQTNNNQKINNQIHKMAVYEKRIDLPRSRLERVNFYGRDNKIKELKTILNDNSIIFITGKRGIGKTELAMQFASEYSKDYLGGICFIRTIDSATIESVANKIIEFFRTHFNNIFKDIPQDIEVLSKIKYLWRNWPEGNILIIIDNLNKHGIEEIENLFPTIEESRFKFLITTYETGFVDPRKFKELHLDLIGSTDSLNILSTIIGQERVINEIDAASKVCEQLGYLPKAIELAAIYLRSFPRHSIQKFSIDLNANTIQHTAVDQFSFILDEVWNHLETTTKHLASLLSIFAHAQIPWNLVELTTECWIELDKIQLLKAQKQLLDLHLLKEVDEGVYEVHSLDYQYFYTKLSRHENKVLLENKFCQAISSISINFNIDDNITIKQIDEKKLFKILPHIQRCLDLYTASVDDDLILPNFALLSKLYYFQGNRLLAKQCYINCLNILERRQLQDNIHIAICKRKISNINLFDGKRLEDLNLVTTAYKALIRIQNKDNEVEISKCLNQISNVLRSLEQYRKARSVSYIAYKRFQNHSLEIQSNSVKEDKYTARNNYIFSISLLGNHEESLKLYKENLDEKRNSNSEKMLAALNNYGMALKFKAELESNLEYAIQAKNILEEALLLSLSIRGENHFSIGLRKTNLALAYITIYNLNIFSNYLDEAENLLSDALNIRIKFFGNNSDSAVKTKFAQVKLLKAKTDFQNAHMLCVNLINKYTNLPSKQSRFLARYKNFLGELYIEMYNANFDFDLLENAHSVLIEAIKTYNKIFSANHPSLVRSKNNLQKVIQLIERSSIGT